MEAIVDQAGRIDDDFEGVRVVAIRHIPGHVHLLGLAAGQAGKGLDAADLDTASRRVAIIERHLQILQGHIAKIFDGGPNHGA